MAKKNALKHDDNPEWTEADFAAARPATEALSAELHRVLTRKRGRPKAEAPKVSVTLRIDPDVVSAFKSMGPGWQTRINAVLRRSARSLVGRPGPRRATQPKNRASSEG